MSLQSQWSDGNDLLFTQRVQQAAIAAAIAISFEATTTANHINRVALAKAITNNPALYAPLFAPALASQGVNGTATDTAIANGVSSVFNALAGVA